MCPARKELLYLVSMYNVITVIVVEILIISTDALCTFETNSDSSVYAMALTMAGVNTAAL